MEEVVRVGTMEEERRLSEAEARAGRMIGTADTKAMMRDKGSGGRERE